MKKNTQRSTKKIKKKHSSQQLLWKRIKAFTSVELLIVISLVAIIGLTALPFLSRFFTQNATSDAYYRMLADFRKAQTYAIVGKQKGPWGVYYNSASNKIILYQGSSYATHTNTAFDETYNVSPSVSISGISDISFAQMTGTPSAATTITITGTSNTTRTIQINTQGIVNYAMAGPTYTPGAPTATPTSTLTPTATPTSAPITLDASTTTSSSTTWSHTTANNPNRIMIVGIGDGGGATSVKYGGQALTKIGQLCAGSGQCISLWYKIKLTH